ncbi:hypothetical protein TcarDRAFT_0704 [Thermosinus carboxydivorans Nor1]|uniref:Uncharacterized protein n=1 Tax=Thermosinus carboxydivorans Nor1 TaxID=401526 RepID=A1HSS1_9FIRM|nr:DUF6385 domain-containing protein [Thermosinus carboxydivorans]EAX46959.1 hypothetical protein TcarDRAFT_0704 [Thermosinus carboxydivorans Nor1]
MGEKTFKNPIKNATAVNGRVLRHEPFKGVTLLGHAIREYNTLVQFDIASLPPLITIVRSLFNVYLLRKKCANANIKKTISVYQIISPWRRGSPVLTNNSPIDSVTVYDTDNVLLSFNVTPLVVDWYMGKTANCGLLLKLENDVSSCLLSLNSKKTHNPQLRPNLQISFLDPLPPENFSHLLDFDANVITSDTIQTTVALSIQRFNYSCFIINTGASSATVSLQISPDGVYWLTDGADRNVLPGEIITIVPSFITRFARLAYHSATPGKSTSLAIRVRGCAN